MYSVVLMMALSGGADLPASHGCKGCCGGCYSCYGCCGGCYGCSGCNGCKGGHHKSCNGCYSCYGCCGGCYGCHGCYSSYSGHGCYSCYGCCGGCYGYSGCGGCYGGAVSGDVTIVAPAGAPAGAPAKAPEPIKKPKTDKETTSPAGATIIVSLPADAVLTVDGAATSSTSATRVFASPALEQGKDFLYTLKAELVRDGKTFSASKKVSVRAGEETKVSLELPEAVAQK